MPLYSREGSMEKPRLLIRGLGGVQWSVRGAGDGSGQLRAGLLPPGGGIIMPSVPPRRGPGLRRARPMACALPGSELALADGAGALATGPVNKPGKSAPPGQAAAPVLRESTWQWPQPEATVHRVTLFLRAGCGAGRGRRVRSPLSRARTQTGPITHVRRLKLLSLSAETST